MKKELLLLLVTLIPLAAWAEVKYETIGDYSYSLNTEGKYAAVRGGASDKTSISIPSSVVFENVTYTVVGVDDMAFWSRGQVTSVSLPSTLKYIGKQAFCGCNMTSLMIPNSVKTIYEGAFASCKQLTTLTLPSNAITFQRQAFSNCISLKSVIIPAGSELQGEVFRSCTSLTNVTIPKNTTLGEQNFWGCTGLTKATIWSSNTGQATFSECTSLSKVIFGSSARTIDQSCFYKCTGLTSFVVPDQIEKIDNSAFDTCTNLTTITLGKGLKTIGSNIVVRCSSLSKVIIPDIASWCQVDIPHGVNDEWFNNSSLYGDENTEIKDLVIPEGVTTIKKYVFKGCKSIESVTLANSVETIGDKAFYDCDNFTTLKIGSGLKSVGSLAMGENYISKVIVPDMVSFCGLSIESSRALYGLDVTRRLYSDENTEITELVIPEGVTAVGAYLFHNFTSITSLTLPNSLQSIGTYAFYGCTGIKSIFVGKGLQSVADYSFFGYRDYSKVDFYIIASTPPTAGGNAFAYYSNKTLHVPESSLNLYKEATGWGSFNPIVALKEGDPGYDELMGAVTLKAKSYSRVYGEENPTFEYEVTSGTIASGSPLLTCSATATSPVGTYDIVIEKGTVTNGKVNVVNGTLTITKAPLTISAGSYEKVEGEVNPEFMPTFSGFKNGDTESVLTKQPTISTTATRISPAGNYPVTVSGAEARNYAIGYTDGTLTVISVDEALERYKAEKQDVYDACISLINAAKTTLSNMSYNGQKTFAANKEAVNALVAKLAHDVAVQLGMLGDTNADGSVTAQDASLILQKVAGKIGW